MEEIIKNIGLGLGFIASVFTITKLAVDILILRKSRLKDDYQFAKEFFVDLQSETKPHPLVIEKGYHVISGDNTLSTKEIESVIDLENPSSSLRDYVLAKDYLEYIDHLEKKISFKKRFKAKSSRKWRKIMWICFYIILYMFTLSPTIFSLIIKPNLLTWIIMQSISGVIFGPLAFMSLKEFAKIYRGEKLIEKQEILYNQDLKTDSLKLAA